MGDRETITARVSSCRGPGEPIPPWPTALLDDSGYASQTVDAILGVTRVLTGSTDAAVFRTAEAWSVRDEEHEATAG
mgnify:CR=1 FL=1